MSLVLNLGPGITGHVCRTISDELLTFLALWPVIELSDIEIASHYSFSQYLYYYYYSHCLETFI